MNDEEYTEVVGVFHSLDDLEQAINDLTSSGWNRAELSLLAQKKVLVPEEVADDTAALADDSDSERQVPVSETDLRQGRALLTGMAGVTAAFVASGATIMTGGGTLAAIIGAAAAGGGAGALAEILGRRVGSHRDQFLQEQIEHGGILLWAKVTTAAGETRACDILSRCGACDVHRHASVPSRSQTERTAG